MRKNFHHVTDPQKEMLNFFNQHLAGGYRIFWDKNAHGMVLCAEPASTSSDRSRYFDHNRFLAIKHANDLKEVFYHYEDGE